MEEREGTITSVANLTLRDSINGEEFSFVNPASVIITEGSIAIYVTINTPKRPINVIKEIKL
jgi:hypothetical protein